MPHASPTRYAITRASRRRLRITGAHARPRATGSFPARANSARSAFMAKRTGPPNACSAPSVRGRSICACRTGFTSGAWRRSRRSEARWRRVDVSRAGRTCSESVLELGSATMGDMSVIEIKAFVPARDFALSKRFYEDLGFTIKWSSDDLAYVQHGNASFLLQNFYVPEHAGNFMI